MEKCTIPDKFPYRESTLNPVSPDQTQTRVEPLPEICHQTEFRLISNPSEILNSNPKFSQI